MKTIGQIIKEEIRRFMVNEVENPQNTSTSWISPEYHNGSEGTEIDPSSGNYTYAISRPKKQSTEKQAKKNKQSTQKTSQPNKNKQNKGEYKIEWEFHKNKTGTVDDSRKREITSKTNDSGVKKFNNEEEAYQFFLEKLDNHAGDYAVKFKFSKDGKTIEDLSGTRLFSGRVRGNETFDSQWTKDQRQRPSDEDPTPYGSYVDDMGRLKTPRQEPIKTDIQKTPQKPKERTIQDIEGDIANKRKEIENMPIDTDTYLSIRDKWEKMFYDFFDKSLELKKVKKILEKYKITGTSKNPNLLQMFTVQWQGAKCFVELVNFLIPKFQKKFLNNDAMNKEFQGFFIFDSGMKKDKKEVAGMDAGKMFYLAFRKLRWVGEDYDWLRSYNSPKLYYTHWFEPGRPTINTNSRYPRIVYQP